MRAVADDTRVKPSLDTRPEQLEWGPRLRLRLERVVDPALLLDRHQPGLAL
ncbi:hypothetical protein [Streptomyces sp. AC550_RSS872]|uniref:hypothetical protein n=1 Tax=Streptomyces sp. AC550_RSS872 TaxID=2823689 RepID=UPI001C253ACB|nr:hypothetical protein [Streptomyces sp. AC550_RSS872]